ncbi:MAG: hypothetical protein J07HQX50_02524 [Haloquadratum sp. J07HQX50]|nr:MAG: hypothetical protein J07HQX50_02524 [Haloquadratum sp. J07HQX50]
MLIGDLSPQSKYKTLSRTTRVTDQKEILMKQEFELDELEAAGTTVE